jgi:hypothetical protein
LKVKFKGDFKVQVAASTQNQIGAKNSKDVKRLTVMDYSKAGIVGIYDWSTKERESHDKIMENYRRYLMKLCNLSHEVMGLPSVESE